jgi:hypothetical protein
VAAQWALIEAHLPKVHTGPERKDDRRVISGIGRARERREIKPPSQ